MIASINRGMHLDSIIIDFGGDLIPFYTDWLLLILYIKSLMFYFKSACHRLVILLCFVCNNRRLWFNDTFIEVFIDLNVLCFNLIQHVFFIDNYFVLSQHICLNHIIGDAEGYHWILSRVKLIYVYDSQQDQFSLKGHFDLQSSLL